MGSNLTNVIDVWKWYHIFINRIPYKSDSNLNLIVNTLTVQLSEAFLVKFMTSNNDNYVQ